MRSIELGSTGGRRILQTLPQIGIVQDIALSAERILVPSSKDSGAGIQAFTEVTGIEIPGDVWDKMESTSMGRTFRLAKGSDMPGQLWAGWADIGIASTELQIEFGQDKSDGFVIADKPICRYSVLALEEKASAVRDMLERSPRYPTQLRRIPATFPKTLDIISARLDLPLAALDVPVTGKGEAVMRASGVGMMAERIVTGNSAQKVGAIEVFKLLDLFPMILVRTQGA